MGAIADVLHLGQNELRLIKAEYPDCQVTNQTNTYHLIQKYRLIIPDEDEDSYYSFLLDNCIAMCSTNFLCRADSDQAFAKSMRARIEKAIENAREARRTSQASYPGEDLL